MVTIPVLCPHCGSDNVFLHGHDEAGKRRYRCENPECSHKTFVANYTNNGYDPKVRSQVIIMTVNGSGTRAISRCLGISQNTVTEILRCIEPNLWYVNYDYISNHRDISAELVRVEESEMDEMWSYFGDKKHQIWLWWAIDHNSGDVLALTFGSREDENLEKLINLLKPFDIAITHCDGNRAYPKYLGYDNVDVGKDETQRIERKHLSLRTWCSRLVRKGIRFSKLESMHIIVVTLIVNYWFFGRLLI
jgi:IS1 family transposase/transposase-like protein